MNFVVRERAQHNYQVAFSVFEEVEYSLTHSF
jgi:hypothetical protein